MMNQVGKFDKENAGISYTLMLIAHARRNYASFRGHAISMSKELYGLDQEEAERLVGALIKAFEEHNLAENENTPENTREQHWENARKALVDYFTILEGAFKRYGIDIDPEDLANNEVAWWRDHHLKAYHKVKIGLAKKYEKLYRLSPEAAPNVAAAELEAMESYDLVKRGCENEPWIGIKKLNIAHFSVLREELIKEYPGD